MPTVGGVRVALGVVLVASLLALIWALPATGRTSSGRAVAVPAAASEEGDEELVPATAPRRLVVAPEDDSGPGPALWVGAVIGVTGLAGLAFSLGSLGSLGSFGPLVNRRRDRQP
ncbi:MAG TPA: hypothetical protein VHH09_06185 [Acidimicrobiales bacterium]|nr:hypothetical protein [Acidimicrobiales bacterium]